MFPRDFVERRTLLFINIGKPIAQRRFADKQFTCTCAAWFVCVCAFVYVSFRLKHILLSFLRLLNTLCLRSAQGVLSAGCVPLASRSPFDCPKIYAFIINRFKIW